MQTTTLDTPKNRVNAGALLLSIVRPNWWMDINLDTLDLTSFFDCVLGQIYGTFRDGRLALRLTLDQTEEFGFFLSRESRMQGEDYYELEDEWRTLIKEFQQETAELLTAIAFANLFL